MSAFFTRVVRFSAAHRYHRPEWSDERNAATFGACANPHGHGHNYTLEATFAGTPDPLTGFAVDLTEVDTLLKSRVLVPLDHQHINYAIEEFGAGRLIPTTENLVAWIWDRLEGEMRSGRLVRLRLYEDPDLFVDYFGRAPAEEQPPIRMA
jgi:6-pyruvoyltetrahydropterin/6-carboxytetrahydropterin synthase